MKTKENILNLDENELLVELSKKFNASWNVQQKGDITVADFCEMNSVNSDQARKYLNSLVAAGELEKFKVRLNSKVSGYVYRSPKL